MKKLFLMLLLFIVATLPVVAQTEGRTSIGIDAGIPVGAAADAYSIAIGGAIKTENILNENTLLSLSFGYTSLPAKQTLIGANIKPPAATYTPLKVGIKYRLVAELYAEAQTGAAFEIRGRRTVRFIYAPGLVYNINSFDLGLRYEGWAGSGSTISQVALRLGYSF
ncbi:hypothetical protein [Mucilaginibacter auburnensis]|uniref:Outer membrane protein with beta-barrel domain n=1 Tax=Mucilaginibacter auburnensis TaxID=1457233 RepID=A0A2H9VPA2_9SPHI|nr:hypothetical protein [Mucilaginibacter auburnensis]PJJ80165.1 hypothetical protein CLV57_3312 [Mucilaginibacter auburnensis]